MRLMISGRMRHGNLQFIFKLVFAKLVFGIDTVTFKYGLNSNKHNIIGIFKCLRELLEGWKPNPLTARSPILKKIKVNDLATVVAEPD